MTIVVNKDIQKMNISFKANQYEDRKCIISIELLRQIENTKYDDDMFQIQQNRIYYIFQQQSVNNIKLAYIISSQLPRMLTSKPNEFLIVKNKQTNIQKTSHPKNKTRNRVMTQRQQPQKLLLINKQRIKLKKTNTNSKLSRQDNIDNIIEIFQQKQYKYQYQIKQLKSQIQQYMMYMKQYQQLAYKNKILQEEMKIILQELQNRNISNYQIKSNKINQKFINQNQPTLQSSIQSNVYTPSSQHYISQRNNHNQINFTSVTNKKQNTILLQDKQVQYLYEYVKKLQNTIEILKKQNLSFQNQLKIQIKKDINDLEKRLMNYFFGLEEKVYENNLKSHHINQKFDTFRDNFNNYQNGFNCQINKQNGYQDSKQLQNEGSAKKKLDEDGESNNFIKWLTPEQKKIHQQQQSKKYIKDHFETLNQQQQKKNFNGQNNAKKQKGKQQLFIVNSNANKCVKCVQYLQIIGQLVQKIKNLQQQLNRYRQIQLSKQNIRHIFSTIKQPTKSQNPNQQQHLNTKTEIPKIDKIQPTQQFPSYQQNKRCLQIYERINLLQTQINTIIQSFVTNTSISIDNNIFKCQNGKYCDDKYYGGEKKYKGEDRVGLQDNRTSSINSYCKMLKIKQQLINIIQQIKQLVQQCEAYSNTSTIKQLSKKIKDQEQQIAQLTQQTNRLRLAVQESKTSGQKLQKLIKIQQEQREPLYFRPLRSPISCIDHNILSSIKKLEVQLSDQNQIKIEGFANTD